jgi:hypothetical protein
MSTEETRNQRRTEPIPPTQPHAVPDAAPDGPSGGEPERADLGAGTSTGPGPRVGGAGAVRGAGAAGPYPDDPVASHVPGVQGAAPEAFGVDPVEGALRTQAGLSSGAAGGGPGAAQGVPVPSGDAAELTSEASPPVDGVRITAVAPPAHADGEPDTRTPPTVTY